MLLLVSLFTFLCATQDMEIYALPDSCWSYCDKLNSDTTCTGEVMGVSSKQECCNDRPDRFFFSRNNAVKCQCTLKKCSKELDPVCASNYNTYKNKCDLSNFKCRNSNSSILLLHKGYCGMECSSKICNNVLSSCALDELERPVCVLPCRNVKKLVCGTDGKTYRSECALLKKWINQQRYLRKAHDGACSKNVTCKTLRCQKQKYEVRSDMKSNRVVKHRKQCVFTRLTKTPVCVKTFVPYCEEFTNLCGSNGKIYPNYCNLLKDMRERKEYITVKSGKYCKKLATKGKQLL